MSPRKPETVDEYIAGFPPEVQERLETVRRTVRKAAPDADEKISYQMPAFALHGILVYFAAFKHHLSLFPAGDLAPLDNDVARYRTSKGTLQFPHDERLPLRLIERVVKHRVRQNVEKASARKNSARKRAT